MNASAQRKAIIVGGGLAGLSAAYRLQEGGYAVTVLDNRKRPGGRVTTKRRDGFILDVGPSTLTTSYKEYQVLAREVGIGDAFVKSSPVMGLARDGRVIDLDVSKPWTLPFTPALSFAAKLQFLRGLWRCRKQLMAKSFDLADDTGKQPESAQLFGERIFGKEVTDYILDPLCRVIVGTGARGSTYLSVLAGLAAWSQRMINLRGGLETMPFAIAKKLKTVILGAQVESIVENGNGVDVSWRDEQGLQHNASADVCVITATLDIVPKIFPRVADLVADYARDMRFLGLASTSLAYSAPTRSKAFTVLAPTVVDQDLLCFFLDHQKAPDRAPPGHSLITLYNDGESWPRFQAMSDEEVISWMRARTEHFFPELVGKFLFAEVTRWPVAGYITTPDFGPRTVKFAASWPKDSRVQLASDLFGTSLPMEQAVSSGRSVAERLLARA